MNEIKARSLEGAVAMPPGRGATAGWSKAAVARLGRPAREAASGLPFAGLADSLSRSWDFNALPAQRPPAGDWTIWLILGGRGGGKTRAGAEWVRAGVEAGRFGRIALVGPTLSDAREVMADGPSGLRRLGGLPCRLVVSRNALVWDNGAEAHLFSAEDPESLRGPQFDAAWADEIAIWPHLAASFRNLMLSVRLGARPRIAATTTPRPTPAFAALLAEPGLMVTRAPTQANAANLAPGHVDRMRRRYGASRIGRQELDGELVEDLAGALWRRDDIERARLAAAPDCDVVVIGVDPPAGVAGAACGIVAVGACGAGLSRRAIVLADASLERPSPAAWAQRAASLARSLGASRIVAEANNGGEMVRAVLGHAAPDLAIRLVHASQGKRARAEPVAALYAAGRVGHAGAFPALEDEMCGFGADGGPTRSPDRLDALVWAVTDVMDPRQGPRARAL